MRFGPIAAGVVARVADRPITASEVAAIIDRLPASVRAEYASGAKKREIVDDLVRTELLAGEAARRGYDRDPELKRLYQQQLISKMLRDLGGQMGAEQVPEKDISEYYDDHLAEFSRPEEIRALQIVVGDRARAEQVSREAMAVRRKEPKSDERGFRDLVTKYSEDPASNVRQGDMGFFSRLGSGQPAMVVDAAFALRDVGAVSRPVASPSGYVVLKLLGRRAAITQPLEQVRRQVQDKLARQRRDGNVDELLSEIRSRVAVEVDEAALGRVSIDAGQAPIPRAP